MSYLPYPRKYKLNWKVVIKTKPRSLVEAMEVSKEAYQVSDPFPSRIVVDTEIPSSLHFISGEVEIVEPSTRLVRIIDGTKSDDTTNDEEEEFVDDIDFESDEDSPQLSD